MRDKGGEKNLKKKIIYPAFLITLLISLALYGGSKVSADNVDSYPPIVQALAEKLGVEESDIEEVFDQERVRFHEERQQMHQDRLEEAVSDGVITEEQKNAILEKHEEMQADLEAYRLQHKEEMDAWFAEQGIDHDVLLQYGGLGFKGGQMHHGMHW